MNFGSWKGHLMVLKRGNQWKHFWRTCTSPTIVLPYVPRLTIGVDNCYDVPIQSSSSSTATAVPVLPHPEHSNVYVSQPYEAIPDQLHILQSCWGRSAQHHSQGTTTSLFWPPWRSTPPSSPPATCQRTLHLNRPTVPPQQVHGPLDANDTGPMDMSDSSV